jgi:protein tyrosine phosphatase (PTP) superfamily phosphohydrolase (DUF442 family)
MRPWVQTTEQPKKKKKQKQKQKISMQFHRCSKKQQQTVDAKVESMQREITGRPGNPQVSGGYEGPTG